MPTVVVRGMPVGRQRISVTGSWVYRELGCARPGVGAYTAVLCGGIEQCAQWGLSLVFWHMEH